MILWAWEAQARGRGGAGISSDEKGARRAAAAWMRDREASTAVLEQVRLATGAALVPVYERTGLRLTGRRHGDRRVTWRLSAG